MREQLILVADTAEGIDEAIEPVDGTEGTEPAAGAVPPAPKAAARRRGRARQASVRRQRHAWRLDDQTRDVGRRGIEQARAVLRASQGRRPAA